MTEKQSYVGNRIATPILRLAESTQATSGTIRPVIEQAKRNFKRELNPGRIAAN